MASVSDPRVYESYFKELYVGCDIKDLENLVDEVVTGGAYENAIDFNNALGKFALRQYKRVDEWDNILYINADTRVVVNVCDVDNIDIDDLGLIFSPKMSRGKDTQAIADGYVNVSI